jgi:hypothetical protein
MIQQESHFHGLGYSAFGLRPSGDILRIASDMAAQIGRTVTLARMSAPGNVGT